MLVESTKVSKDEMHLDDYLQERYGPYGPIMLLLLIALPLMIAISIWFFPAIVSEEVPPATQLGLFIGFLMPLCLGTIFPSAGIYLLIDHLWERKIKRAKDQKFRQRYPYWQPMK
jgi:hypothetical protein